MASSQVQVSSSPPFACAHNLRTFRNNNLSTFVMDRLNDISPPTNDDCNNLPPNAPHFSSSSILDRWASKQLHQTLSTIHPKNLHSSQTINVKAEPLPLPPTGSNTKLGASSLVQIWEKRLSHSNSFNSNTLASSSKQLSELVNTESTYAAETGDFEDERCDAGPGSEDPFADWHSNRTSSSSPPCSTQSRSSDAGDSERVRVADIIRRLASGNPQLPWVDDNDHSNESPCTILREQVEHRCFSQVISSPRIRGRQAFADLLMQMEGERQRELDRLVERRAVSKFGQRGRIQSLLRLRILKRGMAVEDEQRPQPMPSQGGRSLQGSSTIMHLRERFSRAGESGAAVPDAASNPRSPLGVGEMVNNNKIQSTYSSTVTSECSYNGDIVSKNLTHSIDEVNFTIPGDVKIVEVNGPATPHDAIWQDIPDLNLQHSNAAMDHGCEAKGVAQAHDDQPCSYDWFSDICRPRSYWEDRRQSWYQEMLDSNSEKDEIRRLIKRKTVSKFLSSEFRERMDELMVGRLERQRKEEESWKRGGESSDVDYMDTLQLGSASTVSSWSYRDNDTGDDSDSNSNGAPQASPASHRDSVNQECSRSLEIEVIYELRGEMERLNREMSKLRKSIKWCMHKKTKKEETSRKCCICYEMQVDSALYRCGHMCSCMGCGQELQWNGGKCPKCGAPIQDVVRLHL